jgi:hypothetical protein
VRQQLLFESDYVALARRGHPGVKQSAMSKASNDRGILGSSRDSAEASGSADGGCGPDRDSAASAQTSEAGYQTVLARAFRCRASTDVVAKDAESGGCKR